MSTKKAESKPEVKASSHESYATFTILSIIFPLVGIILGIIYLAKDQRVDRKLGEHLIASSILSGIVWAIILGFFGFNRIVSVPLITTTNLDTSAQTASIQPANTHVGSALTIGELSVTVQKVIDPATDNYFNDTGSRLVAVKLQITNNSSSTYQDDAELNVKLIGSDNQNASISGYTVNECTNFSYGSYTLTPQANVTGCAVFELPDGINPTEVQFEANGGFAGDSGEWLVQ